MSTGDFQSGLVQSSEDPAFLQAQLIRYATDLRKAVRSKGSAHEVRQLDRKLNQAEAQLVKQAKDLRQITKAKRESDDQIAELQLKLAETTQRLMLLQSRQDHEASTTTATDAERAATHSRDTSYEASHSPSVLGTSDEILSVLRLCRRYAKSHSTVMITGETGTGKEVIAGFLHASSNRSKKPLIAVNCAALPEALLESILFGHEKGAFTSATEQRIGQFEAADQSTLFLDEIGEMSLAVQAKLLRAIESGEFVRVGGTKPIKVDTRIIVATNRDLMKEVEAGNFREDLFFRVNVLEVSIPPLRDRQSDIRILFDSFIRKIATQQGRPLPRVTAEVYRILESHPWPGNVRELRNMAERCVAICEAGQITSENLPELRTRRTQRAPTETTNQPPAEVDNNNGLSKLAATEKQLLEHALTEAGWNVSKAARCLGISREKLRYRMRKFEIENRSK